MMTTSFPRTIACVLIASVSWADLEPGCALACRSRRPPRCGRCRSRHPARSAAAALARSERQRVDPQRSPPPYEFGSRPRAPALPAENPREVADEASRRVIGRYHAPLVTSGFVSVGALTRGINRPYKADVGGSSPSAPTTVVENTTRSSCCPWSEAGFERRDEGSFGPGSSPQSSCGPDRAADPSLKVERRVALIGTEELADVQAEAATLAFDTAATIALATLYRSITTSPRSHRRRADQLLNEAISEDPAGREEDGGRRERSRDSCARGSQRRGTGDQPSRHPGMDSRAERGRPGGHGPWVPSVPADVPYGLAAGGV